MDRRNFISSSILTLATGLVAIPTLKEYKAEDLKKIPGKLEGKIIKEVSFDEAKLHAHEDLVTLAVRDSSYLQKVLIPSEIFFPDEFNKYSGIISGGFTQIRWAGDSPISVLYITPFNPIGYSPSIVRIKTLKTTIQSDLSLLTG